MLVIEIVEAGRDAAETAVALIGFGGHVDGDLQRVGEALEAAVVPAALGDLVEPALRLLDLVARAGIDRRVIGDVDDVLADLDQFAADRQIVDRAAIVVGVDDGRRLGGEARQILLHVTPPRSCSPRKVFSVIGEASLPARISEPAIS